MGPKQLRSRMLKSTRIASLLVLGPWNIIRSWIASWQVILNSANIHAINSAVTLHVRLWWIRCGVQVTTRYLTRRRSKRSLATGLVLWLALYISSGTWRSITKLHSFRSAPTRLRNGCVCEGLRIGRLLRWEGISWWSSRPNHLGL